MLWHLDKLQLLHFFLISYLISRVFVRFKLPERFLFILVEEKHISISRLAWLVISSTALLSLLIANVITLMALLPVIFLIQSEFEGSPREKRKFSTLILLSAIWGANIGGIGMLTGTTTNGFYVGMLEKYRFPISPSFTFLSWMTWALPLTALLCITGWLVLMLVFRPSHYLSGLKVRQNLTQVPVDRRAQMLALELAFSFLLSSAVLSFAMSFLSQFTGWVYGLTILVTVVFIALIFLKDYKLGEGKPQRLLELKDILHNVPTRGFLWILAGLALTGVLYLLHFPRLIAVAAASWIQGEQSLLLLLVMAGLITTFSTEFLSNSVIQIAMFLTLFPPTKINQAITWEMMLVISLASSCAFMTPIATPSNGLGFGSSRKVSLLYMLGAGLVMNLLSTGMIALWVHYVVPRVLNWFA